MSFLQNLQGNLFDVGVAIYLLIVAVNSINRKVLPKFNQLIVTLGSGFVLAEGLGYKDLAWWLYMSQLSVSVGVSMLLMKYRSTLPGENK